MNQQRMELLDQWTPLVRQSEKKKKQTSPINDDSDTTTPLANRLYWVKYYHHCPTTNAPNEVSEPQAYWWPAIVHDDFDEYYAYNHETMTDEEKCQIGIDVMENFAIANYTNNFRIAQYLGLGLKYFILKERHKPDDYLSRLSLGIKEGIALPEHYVDADGTILSDLYLKFMKGFDESIDILKPQPLGTSQLHSQRGQQLLDEFLKKQEEEARKVGASNGGDPGDRRTKATITAPIQRRQAVKESPFPANSSPKRRQQKEARRTASQFSVPLKLSEQGQDLDYDGTTKKIAALPEAATRRGDEEAASGDKTDEATAHMADNDVVAIKDANTGNVATAATIPPGSKVAPEPTSVAATAPAAPVTTEAGVDPYSLLPKSTEKLQQVSPESSAPARGDSTPEQGQTQSPVAPLSSPSTPKRRGSRKTTPRRQKVKVSSPNDEAATVITNESHTMEEIIDAIAGIDIDKEGEFGNVATELIFSGWERKVNPNGNGSIYTPPKQYPESWKLDEEQVRLYLERKCGWKRVCDNGSDNVSTGRDSTVGDMESTGVPAEKKPSPSVPSSNKKRLSVTKNDKQDSQKRCVSPPKTKLNNTSEAGSDDLKEAKSRKKTKLSAKKKNKPNPVTPGSRRSTRERTPYVETYGRGLAHLAVTNSAKKMKEPDSEFYNLPNLLPFNRACLNWLSVNGGNLHEYKYIVGHTVGGNGPDGQEGVDYFYEEAAVIKYCRDQDYKNKYSEEYQAWLEAGQPGFKSNTLYDPVSDWKKNGDDTFSIASKSSTSRLPVTTSPTGDKEHERRQYDEAKKATCAATSGVVSEDPPAPLDDNSKNSPLSQEFFRGPSYTTPTKQSPTEGSSPKITGSVKRSLDMNSKEALDESSSSVKKKAKKNRSASSSSESLKTPAQPIRSRPPRTRTPANFADDGMAKYAVTNAVKKTNQPGYDEFYTFKTLMPFNRACLNWLWMNGGDLYNEKYVVGENDGPDGIAGVDYFHEENQVLDYCISMDYKTKYSQKYQEWVDAGRPNFKGGKDSAKDWSFKTPRKSFS